MRKEAGEDDIDCRRRHMKDHKWPWERTGRFQPRDGFARLALGFNPGARKIDCQRRLAGGKTSAAKIAFPLAIPSQQVRHDYLQDPAV